MCGTGLSLENRLPDVEARRCKPLAAAPASMAAMVVSDQNVVRSSGGHGVDHFGGIEMGACRSWLLVNDFDGFD